MTSCNDLPLTSDHSISRHVTPGKVWDGLTGTQLQSLATHEADVLCLCVTEGQTEIFASGCDGKVRAAETTAVVIAILSNSIHYPHLV